MNFNSTPLPYQAKHEWIPLRDNQTNTTMTLIVYNVTELR